MTETGPSRFTDLEGLELTSELSAGFKQDGIETPTPVQCAAIPAALRAEHVVIQSGTGTGKTLAYLLPVLQRLRTVPGSRAVCFAPSAELAIQTLRVAERYKDPAVKSCALVAGGRSGKTALQKSTQLIIGTPGKLLEAYERRKLKGVTTIILDEVEPILNNKDADYLEEIMRRPEPKVQLLIAAATFGVRSERWIKELMGQGATSARVEDNTLKERITHHYLRITNENQRDQQLIRCLQETKGQSAIVFVNQANLLRHLYREISERGLRVESVSPERTKQQNQHALKSFREGKAKALLISEAGGVGLDIPNVPWVFHYEMPHSAEGYLHRAGRTGRAGRLGRSVVFVGEGQRARLEKMVAELGLDEFTPWSSVSPPKQSRR